MPTSSDAALASVDLVEFGRRLRVRRRSLGLTQDVVAGQEISAAYVSRIEAGQRRPEIAVARLLATRLDTSIEFLVTGIEPKRAEETMLAVRYAELTLKSGNAADAYRQLLELADNGEDLGAMTSQVTWLIGQALVELGRREDAIECLERASADPGSVPPLQIAILLCQCYREVGDLARAIDVGEHARVLAQEAGLDGSDDDVRLTLALVSAYYERGDHSYAMSLCQRSLAAADVNASAPARGAAYWNASVMASNRGRHSEALALAERALTMLADGDDDRNVARLRTLLGTLLLRSDEPDIAGAREQFQSAEAELRDRGGSVIDIARCELAFADCLLLEGHTQAAIDRAETALVAVRDESPGMAAEVEVLIGRAESARSDLAAAREHYRRAIALLSQAPSDREAAQLWFQLGDLLEQAGDDSGSRDAFRSAAASSGVRPIGSRTPVVAIT